MTKGWQRESKRHSLAAQGIGTVRPRLQRTLAPFARSESFGKQIGHYPFKLEASDSWQWLTEAHNKALRGEESNYDYRIEKGYDIDKFLQVSFEMMLKNGEFWGPEPDFSTWYKLRNASEKTQEYYIKMSKGELAPTPTIDVRSTGEVYGSDGVHRAFAAKRLGLEFMPVIIFSEKPVVV
jgi:hypothetical protein